MSPKITIFTIFKLNLVGCKKKKKFGKKKWKNDKNFLFQFKYVINMYNNIPTRKTIFSIKIKIILKSNSFGCK